MDSPRRSATGSPKPPAQLAVRAETPPAIAAAAALLVRLSRSPDTGRILLGVIFSVAGIWLATFGALADVSLHRGVETGVEPPTVLHVSGRGLATNADLTLFAPEQLPEVAAWLQTSGVVYVRQSFAWSEIEPRAGDFVWDRYDAIVDNLTSRGIRLVAVLHRSPAWARSPEQVEFFDAPPSDPEMFARFANAVAARYEDRLLFYQIWDRPNRSDHWGGVVATPAEYVTNLLSLGFNAVRAANPIATVVLAEFDRDPAGTGAGADLDWLRGVYESGGHPFFHAVAADLRGGVKTPFDRGLAPDLINLSRATLFRDLMIEMGDAARPIWGTHYGWRAGVPPDGVPEAEQAAFAIEGMRRVRAEWPWLGPVFFAALTPGSALGGEVVAGEAMLRDDGSGTVLFSALQAFTASGGLDVAPTGFLPVDAAQYTFEGNWNLQHLGPETFRTTSEVGARLSVQFEGTGAIARVRLSPEAGQVESTLDGRPFLVDLESVQATNQDVTIATGLTDGRHTLVMQLAGPGQLTIGGLIIERSVPLHWTVILLLGGSLLLLFIGLRQIIITMAERGGRLQRRRGVDLWPELPHVGDWRPARRA